MTQRSFAIAVTSLSAALCGVVDTASAQSEAALPAEALSSDSELMSDDTDDRLYQLVGVPEDPSRPRPVYMVIPPLSQTQGSQSMLRAAEGQAPKAAKWIVYMNRNGGSYQPALVNDATQNRSTVPTQPSQIQPWDVSERGWQEVMTCMQDLFSEFNVEITDVDPGAVPHIESVVAGRAQDVGIEIKGVAGVSPFTSDCSVIPNSIVYTFAEVLGTNYRVICEVAAQEVAHSFGLDHQYLCEDPMTYRTGCGDKTFQDVDAPCGEDEERQCLCGASTQNSVKMLAERTGAADPGRLGLDIIAPLDGAVLAPSLEVQVDIADTAAVSKIELYIDDALAGTLSSAPWIFRPAAALASGTHKLLVRAYDSEGSTEYAITVTVEEAPRGSGVLPNDAPTAWGCSSSGGTSSQLMLVLVGAAALLARRRRAAARP